MITDQEAILVKHTHDNDIEKLKLNNTLKNNLSSIADSKGILNNIGSQTMTDAVLTTVIRKQTESLVSETEQTVPVFNTDDTVHNDVTPLNKNFRYEISVHKLFNLACS